MFGTISGYYKLLNLCIELEEKREQRLAKHIGDEIKKSLSNSNISPLDEMDADLEELGVPQGEIESILTHWDNKYLITRK